MLTNLDGLTRFGEQFELLSVDQFGTRTGGRGEVVACYQPPADDPHPRAMVCWFEAKLADGITLDSRGDGRVVTCWGWPLVAVGKRAVEAEGPARPGELTFRVERFEDGVLAVEALLA